MESVMTELSLSCSKRIIDATIVEGNALGLNPLSVVVLDTGGHVKAFERQDGASPGRFAIAQAKAYGSVMLGISGTAQMARAEAQPYFSITANAALDGKLMPVPGGVLIQNALGETLGALGVTGDTSINDLAAGVAGIESVGLVANG
jgi:uncharacterized protein GlcG (DUF336 family)|tara:strand:+ start:7965 stop:8405 length:441 start_codon:yes stop_codon:yes gene_type:complete